MTVYQTLNGATFAALLFVVASGFTLIFGLMRIVNLAHGSLYLFGGYVGLSVAMHTRSFVLASLAGLSSMAIAGFALDRGLLRFGRNSDRRQVLLTLGAGLIANDLALVIWGGDTFTVPVPEFLQGPLF